MSVWAALGRWPVYVATLGVFGVLVVRGLALRLPPAEAKTKGALLRGLAVWGSWFAVALVLATLWRAVCQAINVFGWPDGLSESSLRVVAIESRWGGHWRPQLFAAALVALGSSLVFPLRRLGVAASSLGALALAAALPATGHAWGKPVVWTAQSLHVVGMGVWMGTLLVVLLSWSLGKQRSPRAADLLIAFGPVAMTAVCLVAVSGFVIALAALPGLPSLWQSAWGRLLAAKVVLMGGAVVLGAIHHRALRRPAAEVVGEPPVRLRRGVAWEMALGLAVVTVATLLTVVAQPEHSRADSGSHAYFEHAVDDSEHEHAPR